MRTALPNLTCERVRSQISVLVDGHLSELEKKLVGRHVRRCADCREFEESVRGFTAELRAAPLEPLSRPIAVFRPTVDRSRWVTERATRVAMAAMFVFAAVGVANELTGMEEEPRRIGQVNAKRLFEASWRPEQEQAQLPRNPHPRGAWRAGDDGAPPAV